MSAATTNVYNVPMALKLDFSATDGLEPDVAGWRMRQHFEGIREHIVGPIPIDEFLSDALDCPAGCDTASRLSAKNAFKSVPPTANTPGEICEPLITALNRSTRNKSRCPGFVFENTSRRSLHPRRLGYAKPHISCFAGGNVDTVRRASLDSRIGLGYAELFIQVTADATRDFFNDPPPGADEDFRASHDFLTQLHDESAQDEIEEALGLHVSFVSEIFARQHRTCVFSISMVGSWARLIRWDRAGCVVTEAFDIRTHPEHLCTFLWTFSQAENYARGHDATVEPASMEEEVQFRDTVREHVRTQLGIDGEALDRALTQHYQQGHATIIKMFPHDAMPTDANCRRFVVSRPVVSPLQLVGRGTRGYWAVECTTSRLVFLKDTWRDLLEKDTEGDVLEHLNAIGVRNVPIFVTHCDVPALFDSGEPEVCMMQSSCTDGSLSNPTVCRIAGNGPHADQRQHYRLITGTVGYGLSSLKGTKELLHAMYDAFTAMRDALAKDARIHRDVSAGNIILVKEPDQEIRKGYLIDWEMSDKVDDVGQSHQLGRAGTWRFMSWRMLDSRQTNGRHTIQDDMDSLIHVIIYCALRYLPHKLSPVAIAGTISTYFDYSIQPSPNTLHGGTPKRINAETRKYLKSAGFRSPGLVEWLNAVLDLVCPSGWLDLEYGDGFTPERLDDFWSEFLRTRTLERDDAIVHYVYDWSRRDVIISCTRPPEAIARPEKRPAEEQESEGSPSQKRRRSPRVSARCSGPPGGVFSPPADGPRRSQRIKDLQIRECARNAPARAAAQKLSRGRHGPKDRRVNSRK